MMYDGCRGPGGPTNLADANENTQQTKLAPARFLTFSSGRSGPRSCRDYLNSVLNHHNKKAVGYTSYRLRVESCLKLSQRDTRDAKNLTLRTE